MPKIKMDNILTGILIFMIIIVIGLAYIIIEVPKMGEKFTEFYILNDSGKAGNYLTELKLNRPSTYLVGIVNHEYVSVKYTVEIVLNSEILTSTDLMLGHGDVWENNLTFVPNKEGTDMKLEFLLYKENNSEEPYRRLNLLVNSTV